MKDSIFLERELESSKIELALKPDFNLLDGFKLLDTQGKGFLTSSELINTLKESLGQIEIRREDMYLFFRRYDNDSDGKFTYSDFCHAFTPLSKEYATLLTGRPEFFSNRARNSNEYFN